MRTTPTRWLLGLLTVLLAASGLVVSGASATDRGAGPDPRYDMRIGRDVCTLLGRAYADHITDSRGRDIGRGCSRGACLSPADYPKHDANQEVCRVGGRRGPAYGVPIDSRRCKSLHRIWIRTLNYCVSNPHREKQVVPMAPQCRGQGKFSTYLMLSEEEGFYDQCLAPYRVKQLQARADANRTTLRHVAAKRSRENCAYRPRSRFKGGQCRQVSGPIPAAQRGGVLMVGDSLTWRGSNELGRIRRDWDIDGIPGRAVGMFFQRLNYFRQAHARPSGLIIALGTNRSPNWARKDYVHASKTARKNSPVMFVTPYRKPDGTSKGAIKTATRYSKWMFAIAHEQLFTCVANWRKLATDRPALLVDGVHQTTGGEEVWAKFISTSWRKCLKATRHDGDTGAPTSNGGDNGAGNGGGSGGGSGGGGGDGGGPIPGLPGLPGLPSGP